MDAKSVKDDLRRLMLAAAGAMGLAADEAKKMLDRLVARGEIAEKDAKAIYERVTGTGAGQKVKKAAKDAVAAADRGLEAVLDRLRLPTRGDLDSLQKKIDALNAKIDELTKGGKA